MEVLEQTSDDDESKDQDDVRDSWEEDSILENKGECEHSRPNENIGNKGSDDSRSGNSVDTIIPSESMDTGDKEYDPTTTDSEESVMLTKRGKTRNKKQTTLTQTFGEKINAKEAKATQVKNAYLPPIKRQTRSMKKSQEQ